MRRDPLAAALVSTLVAAGVPAQTTWRVGALVDPVNDFDEIQAAFDAATHGDTIIVEEHAGRTYMPATTDKGVALLSTNAWTFNGSITVVDLPVDQQFVIEGFDGPFTLTCRNCLGGIHAEGLNFGVADGSCGNGFGVTFDHCAFASINHSSVWDVVVDGGTALFTDSILSGSTDCPARDSGQPALTLRDADVTIARGRVLGPTIFPLGQATGQPGIMMQGGTLRFTGEPRVDGVRGPYVIPWFYPPSYGTPIDSNGGTVILDPVITVIGTILGDSTITYEDMPYMRVAKVPAASVGMLPVEVFAPSGATVFACISEPFHPIATFLGRLWLDPRPGGIVLIASGVVPQDGRFFVGSGLNAPWPPGVAPLFQAVVVDQGLISLSQPVIGVGGAGF